MYVQFGLFNFCQAIGGIIFVCKMKTKNPKIMKLVYMANGIKLYQMKYESPTKVKLMILMK